MDDALSKEVQMKLTESYSNILSKAHANKAQDE